MRRAAAAIAVLAACGTSASGWRARVWSSPPMDAKARKLVVPIAPGQNGTELVLGVLGIAKQLDASVSGLEIQIGSCARSVVPANLPAATSRGASLTDPVLVGAPLTDRVLVRAHESTFRCKRYTEQIIIHPKEGIGDTKIVTTDACDHVPIDHLVLRYRYEIDHRFVPPDFKEVERWMATKLVFGAPRCGLPPRTEMRARFHGKELPDPPAIAAPQVAARTSQAHGAFVEASRQAQKAAQAGNADNATRLATNALAMIETAEVTPVDDTLAHWIAAARYHVVEAEVSAVAARLTPAVVDQAWATQIGADIDRVARRYEQIGDFVRDPQAAKWLRAGGARLAKLHARVAAILEEAGYDRPARAARERAKAFD